MNHQIVEQFSLLLKQIEAEYLNAQVENNTKEIQSNSFRLASIKKTINIIKKLDFKITKGNDLFGIPGIGKGTINRIDEILTNGTLSELKNKYEGEKQEKIEGIQDLKNIIGVGDSMARKLVTKYGIRSVKELKSAIKNKKIKAGPKLLLGLKYYGVVQTKIPRKDITKIDKILQSEAAKLNPELQLEICGSYRRGKPTSGDVDILIYHPKIKTMKDIINPGKKSYIEKLVDNLTADGIILDHLTDKNYHSKYMGFCQFPKMEIMRIDIRFVPYESLPTALLYFTGPYELNTYMRERAKKRNLKLNEYGLYEIDDLSEIVGKINIKSEADVFKKLGMKYLEPTEREAFTSARKIDTI